MNEIRNELLLILALKKSKDKRQEKLNLDWLLERFQYDIERQLEDLQYKKNELENNLDLLQYVKQELKKLEEEEK